ncbi:hypothetical protein D7X33_03745 [Butyricicoccus sp. 1XD8-22]|nr:hypothetical protein D7X33_03745 [Butyricicoccus sp. 1XD8-22]
MELSVFDDRKMVTIWLTHAERDDPEVQEQLKPIYRFYAPKKYVVAVFSSGNQDLYRQTSDLVCYNRKRIAELEVKAEQTS